MKSRYEGIKSKEEATANNRQAKYQAVHESNDAFVRKNQAMQASMGAKAPNLMPEYQKFDACMTNDGMHAQEFARSLTYGLDKKAFPVK